MAAAYEHLGMAGPAGEQRLFGLIHPHGDLVSDLLATLACHPRGRPWLNEPENRRRIVYLDPRSNRFGFSPWDLDHSWGEFPFVGTAAERERANGEQQRDGDVAGEPWVARGCDHFQEGASTAVIALLTTWRGSTPRAHESALSTTR